MTDWPDWWSWELELSPHLLKRMVDRGFNGADLRKMLEDVADYYANHEEGRWVILTALDNHAWEIIVEPDEQEQVLVIVTAYPVG